jgi:hypothetical protein
MLQLPNRHAPLSLLPLALLGFVLALFGTYWDDAWHTDKGRDSFLIPPHLCLYAGISLVGLALTLEVSRRVRTGGRGSLADPAIALSLAGVVITLIAAPIDNAWHLAFGRDAVLWSPPHMLGVAGSLALAVGLLMLLVDGKQARALQLVAAAAVLAVGLIPVLEYETDVPQFAVVWFLPLLAFGSAFALGLARSLLGGRWAATATTAVYSLLRALIAVVLLIAGLPVPLLPLLLLPALVLDLLLPSRDRLLAAVAFSVAIFALYVPYMNWIKSDIYLGLEDVLIGLPLAVGLSYLALILADQPRNVAAPRPNLAATGPATVALMLVVASSALAHDPGQGEDAGSAALTAKSVGDRASLTIGVASSADCDGLEPVSLVARRAGVEVEAPLERVGECRFHGTASLPERGRWFVYGEFDRQGQAVEAWLPVHVGAEPDTVSEERLLYNPPSESGGPIKIAAGLVVYAFLAAVVLLIARLIRRRPAAAPVQG